MGVQYATNKNQVGGHVQYARSSVAIAVARALVAGTAGAWALPALTQESALEEIVVTAERRETALQDTPISIIAMSSETLDRKGIEDLADIALFTPNLAIKGSRGDGNNQPSFLIRGIAGGGGATSERGVALYIDGIYVPRTNGSIFKVFDIERVEVLRGPQGTLFGRNSTGGAIRLFTKQPAKEFDSYIGYRRQLRSAKISGMVNVPVSDNFALRAQAAYLDEDGYVERGTQTLGGSEDILARLQAAYHVERQSEADVWRALQRREVRRSPRRHRGIRPVAEPQFQGNYADWLSDASRWRDSRALRS